MTKKRMSKRVSKRVRRGVVLLLVMAISLVIGGCSCAVNDKDSQSNVNNTATGSGAAMPGRVVALSKSVGDLWLLSGGQLVGATQDAFELEGISKDAVSIGTISTPNEETIIGLNPDYVILSAEFPAHIKIKERLDSLGIPVKAVDINSFDDYEAVMNEFTSLTGRKDLYKKNCEDVKNNIDKIINDYNSKGSAKGKTYLCMRVSASKNKALKNDYFACDILNDYGLVNVAESNTNLTDLSLEAITASNPDYIFVIYQGDEKEAMKVYEDVFTSQKVWNELNAVKNNKTYLLPKDLFQYKPNAKWDEAYKYIYEIIK